MNSGEVYRSCLSFLTGENPDADGWESLDASAEAGTPAALSLILQLIAATDDCEQLGAIAGGPLWTLLQNGTTETVVELERVVTEERRVARCIAALDRYRQKIFRLQRRLSRLSGCENVPDALRPMRAEHVVRVVLDRWGEDRCVRITNPYARRHELLDEKTFTSSGGRDLQPTEIEERWSRLLAQIETDTSRLQDLAIELDHLLLEAEHALLSRVVKQISVSVRFRCCMSYTILLTLSESTVDVLLAVAFAVDDGDGVELPN